jgi:hypothetical protein
LLLSLFGGVNNLAFSGFRWNIKGGIKNSPAAMLQGYKTINRTMNQGQI